MIYIFVDYIDDSVFCRCRCWHWIVSLVFFP